MSRPKRVFDCAVALALLACLWPVIAICSGLVVLVDRQAPFFAARRVGKVCRTFTMWKLRTMTGADDGLPTGAAKADRITSLGRVLRRWRLDELPQLWNVVVGDMSLIGPRPPSQKMVNAFPRDFAQMLTVHPGITGLATVTMSREEQRVLGSAQCLSEVESIYATKILPCKLAVERYYVQHHSLALDMWILWQTVCVILRGSSFDPNSSNKNWDTNVAGL